MTITHLFTVPSGASHFDEIEVGTLEVDFAPPAPKVFASAPTEPKRHLFLVLPPGWYGEPHPAPARQLMSVLRGALEVTASGGAVRRFSIGDTALVEDTWGEGHATRNTGDGQTTLSITQYGE